jgi:hypothetical protein
MERTSTQSEVARLSEQIDGEINAMRLAMDGFAAVSRHEIITHRFENIGTCFKALADHVGEQAAIETIIAKLEGNI